MIARYINRDGFTLKPIPGTSQWDFRLDPDAPLEWVEEDGSHWQPDRHQVLRTDGMSGGPAVHLLVGCGQFEFAGVFYHDAAYVNGGLWREGQFFALSKVEADWLLARQIVADEGSRFPRWRRRLKAVRVFVGLQSPMSWAVWRRYRKAVGHAP